MGKRIAFVDIGSNTLKFSVTEVEDAGAEKIVVAMAETVRLGAGVAATGRIEPERIALAVRALRRFEGIGLSHGATAFRGVATAALRMATNGNELLNQIRSGTLWQVRVISGDEEARLTFLGLKSELPPDGNLVIADIGGASTELIRVEGGAPMASRSIQLGSGSLADRCFSADPPGQAAVVAAGEVARGILRDVDVIAPATGYDLVLSGGNGTFLRGITAWERVRLPFIPDFLHLLVARLADLPAIDVARFLDIAEERARMLPAGGAIALALVELLRPSSMTAVPSGIRGGIVREWLDAGCPADPGLTAPVKE